MFYDFEYLGMALRVFVTSRGCIKAIYYKKIGDGGRKISND